MTLFKNKTTVGKLEIQEVPTFQEGKETINTISNLRPLFVTREGDVVTNTDDPNAKSVEVLQVTGVTLVSANWVLVGGLYEYNLANANITSTSIVDIIPDNSTLSIVQTAQIAPQTVSSTGSVKVYAKNQPTGNIIVTLNIWK